MGKERLYFSAPLMEELHFRTFELAPLLRNVTSRGLWKNTQEGGKEEEGGEGARVGGGGGGGER